MDSSNARPEGLVPLSAEVTSRCRCIQKPGQYMILPKANRVEHNLPEFEGVQAQVLASPQLGADFVEHELLVYPGAKTPKPIEEDLEGFFFVLEGDLDFELGSRVHRLRQGSYCWLPPHESHQLRNRTDAISRIIWVRRRYVSIEGAHIPAPIIAHESDVLARPVDTYMEQHLTPYEQLGFDLGINIQVFEPGVYFSYVEAHVMEHGLYMMAGQGIYWLSRDYHEVQRDDFIYMAPFCPQFYYATGRTKSAYLLYKDVNRDYVQFL